MAGETTLFLCGDVMLGRGVDQVLAHPGDPRLREPSIRDARDYVRLAEAVHGPVPRPVDAGWPWGDALPALDALAPHVRVLNLETSVTTGDDFAPGKRVHYRMHPANLPALAAARPDVCALANNHVLDFGPGGLAETLDALAAAGLRTAGAGRDAAAAEQPAALPAPAGRVLVLSVGTTSSGIPEHWAAGPHTAGVALLPDLSTAAADAVADRVNAVRRPGDLAVVSVHWGPNWGYGVAPAEARFAHRLVAAGIDVVHGHSSHHPRAIEVHRGRLVLYGCGDLVDDYEGIPGHERYRPGLRLLYLASLEAGTGRLTGLRMTPLESRQLRLRHAAQADAAWLRDTLTRAGAGLAPPVGLDADGTLRLRP